LFGNLFVRNGSVERAFFLETLPGEALLGAA
jgi:hypothetical protein